jgi:hypothetical protein
MRIASNPSLGLRLKSSVGTKTSPSAGTLPILAALRHWSLHTPTDGDGDEADRLSAWHAMRVTRCIIPAHEKSAVEEGGGEPSSGITADDSNILHCVVNATNSSHVQ